VVSEGCVGVVSKRLESCFSGGLVRRGLRIPVSRPTGWSVASLRGCLSELSGDRARATLSLAFELVYEAQACGDPVAFVTGTRSVFYPPDVASVGVDLGGLVVVRVADVSKRLGAAIHLARSGAFGLLVIDLEAKVRVPGAVLTALVGHAQQHEMAVVFLTEKGRGYPSVGSVIRVRAEGCRRKVSGEASHVCQVEILKDKRRGPGFIRREAYCGPDGLC